MSDALKKVSSSSRAMLLLAAALVLALTHFVRWGRYVLYPFVLLTTWIHESGHGITAIILGGQFDKLEIFGDASGVATTATIPGWRTAAVCLGGLLMPPLVGSLVLATVRGPKRAAVFLGALTVGILFSVLMWVRSATGIIAMPGLAVLFILTLKFGNGALRLFLSQAIAVMLALDTATRMVHYVFMEQADGAVGGSRSDVGQISDTLGLPITFWGVLIAGTAILMLIAGLWLAFRPVRGGAPEAPAPMPKP